jgi:hypothetical protein
MGIKFRISAAGDLLVGLLIGLFLKAPIALVSNAVTGWVDNAIGEYFGLVSPSVASVVEITWQWIVPFAAAALILIAYHHWNTRQTRTRAKSAPSTQRTNYPFFEGNTILSINYGKSPEDHRQLVALVFVQIANTGTMPSIATHWRVYATHDDKTYEGRMIHPNDDVTFTEKNGTTIRVYPKDAIYSKTSRAVQPGDSASGFIFAKFAPVDNVELAPPAKFTIGFKDVLSKDYETSFEIVGKPTPIMYYPGFDQDITVPKK